MGERKPTRAEVQAEIPTWPLVEDSKWAARSPTWEIDGIVVVADSAERLIQRVRNIEIVVSMAMGRNGTAKPSGPVVESPMRVRTPDGETVVPVIRTLPATPEPEPASFSVPARVMGYTGDTCQNCQGLKMRRNGTCLLCDDCGATTGCS